MNGNGNGSDRFQRRLTLRLRRSHYHQPSARRRKRSRLGRVGAPLGSQAAGEVNPEMELVIEKQREQLLRLQAEFENFRRRSKKEVQDIRETANSNILKDFLPIVDNFNRALLNPGNSLEGFIDGIKMVNSLLENALKSAGLERLDAVGKPFDPHFHEAVMVDNSGEHPENAVVEVLQEGFMIKGKLVRPALVKVSRQS